MDDTMRDILSKLDAILNEADTKYTNFQVGDRIKYGIYSSPGTWEEATVTDIIDNGNILVVDKKDGSVDQINLSQKALGISKVQTDPERSWTRDPSDPESKIPAYIRKSKEPGKKQAYQIADKLNKELGADVWRSPRESVENNDNNLNEFAPSSGGGGNSPQDYGLAIIEYGKQYPDLYPELADDPSAVEALNDDSEQLQALGQIFLKKGMLYGVRSLYIDFDTLVQDDLLEYLDSEGFNVQKDIIEKYKELKKQGDEEFGLAPYNNDLAREMGIVTKDQKPDSSSNFDKEFQAMLKQYDGSTGDVYKVTGYYQLGELGKDIKASSPEEAKEKFIKDNTEGIKFSKIEVRKKNFGEFLEFREGFEIGDEFGISIAEDFEIGAEIVDILEDGVVIELDETAINYLSENGFTFDEGEIFEGEQHGNSKIYDKCWKGYKKVPGKKRGEPGSCKKIGESGLQYYTGKKKYGKDGMAALAKAGRDGANEEELGRIKDKFKKEDYEIDEAEYQGRKVPLGKPMKGDVKKSKVYVKNPQGNVVKVNFGDKNMKIKKSNPARKKSFRARHNCSNPGPRHKARYWSCRAW
jgi:hypothetical protein